ncbi:monovalent cation:proton antiporter family protein [Psychroflexus planctonicus]|uniref:Sodium/hydrogen exchanger n=1 Tax=Psychroflexus planctonicus TaxID=1526575 RepID=A0ABQ1SDL9_9FLAO|nr:monovalent cation:proton antiporter family protein [Psychroflexus planctonicus]GGE30633.1 sodium/hydrogen exchanger [Psychroflexus planctonicus]
MEIPLLKEIVIVMGIALPIILLFQKLKVPSILGFLIAGIIVGPSAFNLLSSHHEVELLSEIGIIFLLFIIGIELSFKGLISIWRTVFIGGGLQVGFTILITALVAMGLGLPINQSVFLGFLISLSSTAIVLKILNDRNEIKSTHGRMALGILIFQDIIVVPMMLLTPILAGKTDDVTNTLLILLVKLIGVGLVVFVLQRYIVPWVLELVVKTKNRELFILTVIVLCFGVAWLTSSVGLSLALGAFFAGLIISESEYSHQATANVLPFREIFISFFFISVGSLLDLNFFIDNVPVILGFVLGVFLLKKIIVVLIALLLKYDIKNSHIAGFNLFQVGEFSLLLSTVGIQNEILTTEVYQLFLAVSIITMGITPFIMAKAGAMTNKLIQLPVPKKVRKRMENRKKFINENPNEGFDELEDHLVIIGYGINGKNIARVAESMNIPHVIIEFDAKLMREAKAENKHVVFGDASQPEILNHVNAHKARVIVIAISDKEATHQIIFNVRQYSQTTHIIVRTRYVKEIDENLRLGADEVIPEEFETSIEIFSRVLKQYLVTESKISEIVNSIRSSDYELFSSVKPINKKGSFEQFNVPNKELATLHVQHGRNDIVGKVLSETGLANKYQVNLLAIKRGRKYITNIGPDTTIKVDDLIYLFGSPNRINTLNKEIKI